MGDDVVLHAYSTAYRELYVVFVSVLGDVARLYLSRYIYVGLSTSCGVSLYSIVAPNLVFHVEWNADVVQALSLNNVIAGCRTGEVGRCVGIDHTRSHGEALREIVAYRQSERYGMVVVLGLRVVGKLQWMVCQHRLYFVGVARCQKVCLACSHKHRALGVTAVGSNALGVHADVPFASLRSASRLPCLGVLCCRSVVGVFSCIGAFLTFACHMIALVRGCSCLQVVRWSLAYAAICSVFG